MASSGSDYINRIKNETNRIKRRQKRTSSNLEQSLPTNHSVASNKDTGSKAHLGQSQAQPLQSQQPQKPESFNDLSSSCNKGCDEDSISVLQLVPPDTRGESASKLDVQHDDSGKRKKSFTDPVPRRNMSNHLHAEHEAFRQKLIDDVLGDGANDRVPMEKVVMLIWQYREDPQVVKFMTRFVAKVRKGE